MSSAARWKRQEREVASALGTHRLPNIGRGQPDCRAGGVAYQIKTRGALPDWLWQAMDQAERDAGPGEAAAVVLAEVVAGRKTKRLLVMEFGAFLALVAAPDDGRAPPRPPTKTPTAAR